MQRYAAWMPYSSWVSLGEGGTPCTPVRRLADEVGVAALHLKNEGMNPSGSHKDRVSCLTVTRALDIGATKIVAASSGNGGASLALYAAAAGIECCIVSTPALSPIHRRAITLAGADLVIAGDSLERWQLVTDMVTQQGWFPATNYLNPPVGSNHFGIEGLKTLAFELVEDLGRDSIDAVLVPTSRGDLLWGLYEGFRQLKATARMETLPRLFAVEPFPRIDRVLHGAAITGVFPGSTTLFSIGGSTVTYQAAEAIRQTGGGAVVVDDAAVARDQVRLARHGCYAELSSAATLTALELLLQQGTIARDEAVVLIATSNGYKDSPDAASAA
ncbi:MULTISPECIES: pyridoxal-phosphate dependent enzyme [unclassified Sphingomonas]|uniref:threonine synthase n=1 Tax=unclassified Sphingomonas TaxID=196159 RepID=UPI001AC5802C|nr:MULTISPECIES: pyridoxal-phosphate dependent enzyme [unclassified Sphingomonas]MBN8849243.1 pyridoxal-phosphate dependent enzyme [Sphingomonas sp.]